MTAVGGFLSTPCRVVTVTATAPSTPSEPRYDDMGEPIVEDDMGQTPPTETAVETVCDAQQSSAKELRDGGLVDVTTWRLFLPAGFDLEADSRVELLDGSGDVFHVEGSGWTVRDPFEGVDSHVEAVARQVK